jgi:hypothetical protein
LETKLRSDLENPTTAITPPPEGGERWLTN